MKSIKHIIQNPYNHLGQERIDSVDEVAKYLTDALSWSDDDFIHFESDGVKGCCQIDELLGEEVQVGQSIILITEGVNKDLQNNKR